jgi:hypothetical protein
MNRRHSQSSYATPVKSLTMSDDANTAIGTKPTFFQTASMSAFAAKAVIQSRAGDVG